MKRLLKNKNVITILAIVLLVIMALSMTGCVTVVEETQNGNVTVETPVQGKPLTKQVCDWTGWNSGSIIEEQAQQGYVYTGRSNSFWCGDDMLNFQLKEGE